MVVGSLITELVVIGVTALGTLAAVRSTVRGQEKRLDRLEGDYVPRHELNRALQAIEKICDHTNALVRALLHSSGDRHLALKAIEAAAVEGPPQALDWMEPYVRVTCPRFEGAVPYLYLDTQGHVTCGSGTMVPDASAALLLPLRDASGEIASRETILADFTRVQRLRPGMLSTAYRCATSLLLSEGDQASLRRVRCAAFVGQLRVLFAGFDTLPVNVRLALLDMAYNLGAGRLLREYPHFCSLVLQRAWGQAAEECDRNPGDRAFFDRNNWTRQHLLTASAEPLP